MHALHIVLLFANDAIVYLNVPTENTIPFIFNNRICKFNYCSFHYIQLLLSRQFDIEGEIELVKWGTDEG